MGVCSTHEETTRKEVIDGIWSPECFGYDLAKLKEVGIDIAANDYTALVHFRGSW